MKCDVCGKFISYKELLDGKATRKLVSPDSIYTRDRYETLCGKCKDKEKKQ